MKKKNAMWKKLFVVLMAVFSLSVVAPELSDSLGIVQTVQAAVKLNCRSVTLVKGEKKTLKLTGTKKTPKWTSSDVSVAAVSSKGVVTAKKRGTATITAKIGSKKYTCKVTVETPKLSKTSISVTAGKSYQLKMSGTKQTVTWTQKDKKIAVVSKSGKVTGKKAGTTTITAQVGTKKYTCKVTVKSSSSDAQKTAFEKLKKYIVTVGSKNSDGNYFISAGGTLDGTKYTWGIVYNRKTKCMEFILTSKGNGAESALEMKFKVSASTADSVFYFILTQYDYAFSAKTSINVKKYNGKSDLKFTITKKTGSDVTQSDVNKLANSFLKLGFSGWQEYLLKPAGTSFKSLGFTAYK